MSTHQQSEMGMSIDDLRREATGMGSLLIENAFLVNRRLRLELWPASFQLLRHFFHSVCNNKCGPVAVS